MVLLYQVTGGADSTEGAQPSVRLNPEMPTKDKALGSVLVK